jgi:hypothetical protein
LLPFAISFEFNLNRLALAGLYFMDLKALPNLVAIQITVIALFAVIYRHITSILNNTIRALCMDEQSFICCDCIGDLFLREQLKEDNESGVCSYCSMSGLGGSLTSVAEMVENLNKPPIII